MAKKTRNINERSGALKIKKLAIDCLERDKAEEITIIDLEGKTDFAHFMIICSGRSTRHVMSIAEKLMLELKHSGLVYDLKSEGMKEGKWILIDALDVIIHVFTPETRENYSLEKIWGFTL